MEINLLGNKQPSAKELEVAVRQLTPRQQRLLADLNRLALGLSIETLCSERKQQMGLEEYRDWLRDLKDFGNRWPAAYV